MAGMFYSLEEVAEKLHKTEEEIKEFIRQGKLREFRDGPNLLFKIDEVEALMADTSVAASKSPSDEDEILLAPEPAELSFTESGLTHADTVLSGGGTDILKETGQQEAAEDLSGETKADSAEASLEEIEDDVNLDTFGSGSGLLDLSLQADDTSLGGILDEIYTPEGAEEQEAVTPGSDMEVGADAEQMLSESLEAGPDVTTMVRGYVEPEPDTISNALGLMLFLPLLAVIYTAVVAVAGFSGLMPAILEKIQGAIWYIMIGAAVAAGLIIGGAFMLSSSGGTKTEKKPKAKKEKKPKKQKKKKVAEAPPEPEA